MLAAEAARYVDKVLMIEEITAAVDAALEEASPETWSASPAPSTWWAKPEHT